MKRILLVALFALAVAGCGLAAGGLVASQYTGTYKGMWTNLSTGATGAGTITVGLDNLKRIANMTLDFDGNYLGLNDPPPIPLTGTYDANGAVVKGSDAILGDYVITIDRAGNIVGHLERLAGGAIPELNYTGTVTKDRIDTVYKVTRADGVVVTSTFSAQKVTK